MQIELRLAALASAALLCVSCSSIETSTTRKTMIVVGTVIEIDTTEETLRYTLIDGAVLCNLAISVDSYGDTGVSEFTPMVIIIPQFLGESLGIKGDASMFFRPGKKWQFDARKLDTEDNPIEVGSFVGGIPMIMIAERAELADTETRKRPDTEKGHTEKTRKRG